MRWTARLRLYFETLRYLKAKQLFFQIVYRFRRILPERHVTVPRSIQTAGISLDLSIPSSPTYNARTFKFLNMAKTFPGEIDWDFSDFGKLWTYNLNYFDFLNQEDLTTTEACGLIDSYCIFRGVIGKEPYPISLRTVNWIKFFVRNGISTDRYDRVLFADYSKLMNNLEFHLMGNHLLENACSLLFGGCYFNNEVFYETARKLLYAELEEQILQDGGHFERSPMYHQILLMRLLDCINLLRTSRAADASLLKFLTRVAERMLAWLEGVTFSNGQIPCVNDSAHGIAPETTALRAYARRLDIHPATTRLGESGYRMYRFEGFELFADIGNIGPDYIPGHAHSDTLSFVLYLDGKPVIVDTAVSTYEPGPIRDRERSTRAHNTVQLDDLEQSEMWSAFRVGRRARIVESGQGPAWLRATHDGYQSLGAYHTRTWTISDGRLHIADVVHGSGRYKQAVASLHFHPSITLSMKGDRVIADGLEIFVESASVRLEEYLFAAGFNLRVPSTVMRIVFKDKLEISIAKLH